MLILISSLLLGTAVGLLVKFSLNPAWIRFNMWNERDAATFQQWSYEIFFDWTYKKSFQWAWWKNLGIIVISILVLLSGKIALAILFFVIAYFAPRYIYEMYKVKQNDKVEDQLPDAINIMVSSVRAGRSLAQAVEDVAEKTEKPIKLIFDTISRENKFLGLPIYEALQRAKTRVNLDNFSMLASALAIGSEKGGDTLYILERISASIRELSRLRKKIRVETTEIRSQKTLILWMAPVFLLLAYIFNPSVLDILFNTIPGGILLLIVVGLIICSNLIIKRILRTAI